MTTPIESQGKPRIGFIIMIVASAALGGFLFGYDTAVINGAVLALQQHFAIGEWATGLSVSLALLGSAVGAFLAGPMADRVGRVRSMQVCACLFAASAIGSGLPFSIYDFILWRVLGGVAVGAASVLAPAYIAEVAPAEMRGRLGSMQQLAIVVGIFVALLMNYVIVELAGGSAENRWLLGLPAWKWMFLSELPPAVIFGIAVLFIPESPRYLVAVGKLGDAEGVLTKLFGVAAVAKAKVAEIAKTISAEHAPRMSDLRGPTLGLMAIVWIGVALAAFQQLVGINVIFYYSSTLWRAAGFGEEDALKITVITGAVNIVTTLIAIAFVDRLGRKPLLLIGSAGMAVALFTMALCFAFAGKDASGNPMLSGALGWTALIAANLYVFFFGASWGPVVWVLLGEMFPNRIRAAGLAVGACIGWVANFTVSTTFPPMLKGIGLGASYLIYGGMAVISFFFVWRFIQETKGRELEDM
ncbi:sugar porter family MFS transporter [Oscillatoria amoena NRMC-F 0135]|nr:sugar porter family MFS transporter [Oscillatoria laete-virens]MDL5047541.1 sugar porter family MFS transporter [Oscillatoria amoena NRMC-F 0135]MDL5054636.1 sugar porter family MFS transporter [Oscillatoria laete-virens NRMC-F 0139]